MFASAQPKVVTRALLPVLVMMPMGTKADDAMIVIALFGVMLALSLLFVAAIAVGGAAQRWLAPLPVRRAAVIRALAIPACGAATVAGTVASLLLLVFNVSQRISAVVGAIAAVAGCSSIFLALVWNTRSRVGR
jgi:ABC-type thiamin/hydroxymethylpyrimidine transport system permease subunit